MSDEQLHLLLFLRGQPEVHPLPATGRVTLGRGEGNDVRIDDPSVSRRHAVLHLGPTLQLEDLGSANGTVVHVPDRSADADDSPTRSQHRVPPNGRATVTPGDHLQLGSSLVIVERGPAPASAFAQPPSPSPTPRAASRAGRQGPGEGDAEPVVQDAAMARVHQVLERVASSAITVLILGETGVGKEVLARALHARSARAERPFVALNCAALSESLLESELFGHEKGAFTGALAAKPGLIESAEDGTVFLDEIGDLPLALQVKLLRVLEERAVLRVGALRPRPVDVRFVAATHRDLQAEIARGAFRQDLYFRLSGVVVPVPPLRARRTEIAPLAELFLRRACARDGRAVPALAPEALSTLLRHDWPGNVRELRNVIERAALLQVGDVILPEHLFPELSHAAVAAAAGADAHGDAPRAPPASERVAVSGAAATGDAGALPNFRREVAALERQRILEALERAKGNQTRAAALLGISRRTLVTRLGEYDIPRPRKRPPR